MRIKLTRHINGADGTARAGDVVDWSDAVANGLLEGGYAELVEELNPEPEPVAEVAVEPEVETAVSRPRRATRRDQREAAGSE